MNPNWNSVSDLISGLQVVLSKHRSSFTDEEIKLLEACIERLRQSQRDDGDDSFPPVLFVDAINVFLKVFTLIGDIDKFL